MALPPTMADLRETLIRAASSLLGGAVKPRQLQIELTDKAGKSWLVTSRTPWEDVLECRALRVKVRLPPHALPGNNPATYDI